jgi:VanZ family protein
MRTAYVARLLVCVAYWILLTVLLLVPNPQVVVGLQRVPLFPWGDVGIHFTAFIILSVLVHLAVWPKRVRWTVAVLMAYGIATESLQLFVPPRSVELKDYAENILGVLAGAGLYLVFRRLLQEVHKGVQKAQAKPAFSAELAKVSPRPLSE